MKKIVILTLLLMINITAQAASTVPQLINYQGRLTDANGAPLDGTYQLEFNIYDASSEGTIQWGPQVFLAVPVINGVFNVVLGTTDTAGKAISEAFTAEGRYLGIKLDTSTEITPRQQILSAPYAIKAQNGVPIGTVHAFAGHISKIPNDWFLCDGRSLESSSYPALYNIIGEKWGDGGDGTAGLFSIPDMRGLFLRGANQGRTDEYKDPSINQRVAINGSSIEEEASLQKWSTAKPATPFVTDSNTHSHSIPAYDGNGGGYRRSYPYDGYNSNLTRNTGNTSHTHEINSGGDIETRSNNASINYIIRVK
jgi:microcystin-dependent protein